MGTDEQEELIDLQCDEGAQEKFKNHKLAEFWLNLRPSYPALAKNAIPQFLIFPTTWKYKQGFSTFLTIKSKEDKKSSRKPRAQFPIFCEENISATCETS